MTKLRYIIERKLKKSKKLKKPKWNIFKDFKVPSRADNPFVYRSFEQLMKESNFPFKLTKDMKDYHYRIKKVNIKYRKEKEQKRKQKQKRKSKRKK